jgi:hypothetical protein
MRKRRLHLDRLSKRAFEVDQHDRSETPKWGIVA